MDTALCCKVSQTLRNVYRHCKKSIICLRKSKRMCELCNVEKNKMSGRRRRTERYKVFTSNVCKNGRARGKDILRESESWPNEFTCRKTGIQYWANYSYCRQRDREKKRTREKEGERERGERKRERERERERGIKSECVRKTEAQQDAQRMTGRRRESEGEREREREIITEIYFLFPFHKLVFIGGGGDLD